MLLLLFGVPLAIEMWLFMWEIVQRRAPEKSGKWDDEKTFSSIKRISALNCCCRTAKK